jgi:uncharacterized protein (TIGR02231 family)
MLVFLLIIINLEVHSEVDSAVVYSDRVMVTRITQVYLDKTTDIVFTDLPGALDDATVKVKAEGLKIGEVQVKKRYAKEPHPKIKVLFGEIETLENKDRTLSDELTVLKDKEKFLQTIAVGGPEVISKEILTGKVSPQSWRQGLKFMTDELLSTKKRQAEIERQRKDLKEEIDALQNELNDMKSIVANRKNVSFDARPMSTKTYTIHLTYIVYGAQWRTYYELRAYPSSGKMTLSYFSKINQRTGEDWDNTKIVLSTAKPALGGAAPRPGPWYIRRIVPMTTLRGGREDDLYYKAEALEELSLTTADVVATPPVEAGISIWYPLPGRCTIKSGDSEKKIQIYETSFHADFEYFIVPRIIKHAYSTGKMQNTSKYLFIAGEAGTYVGDDFTGKTYLSTIAPDESTTVSFGIDERVRVERELKKSKVIKGGFFGSKTKYDFTYENRVKNFHNKEILCTIVDQVPIPQDPDIKVSSIKLEPKPSEEDKDQGIYYWHVLIGAGDEYIINVSFTVEAPRGVEVQGLMP